VKYYEPPTRKQMTLLRKLGPDPNRYETREDAADAIDRILNAPPTLKQISYARYLGIDIERTEYTKRGFSTAIDAALARAKR
jgi:hypothetical protein